MSALDDYARAFGDLDLDPTECGENYIPTVSTGGTTHPFRTVPVVIARPAAVAERPGPEGDFCAENEEVPWSAIWFTAFLVLAVLYALSLVR